jgi:hypothetical protein
MPPFESVARGWMALGREPSRVRPLAQGSRAPSSDAVCHARTYEGRTHTDSLDEGPDNELPG